MSGVVYQLRPTTLPAAKPQRFRALRSFFSFLRRWKLVILTGGLLGCLVAAVLPFVVPTEYVASATLKAPRLTLEFRNLIYSPALFEAVVKDVDLVRSYGIDSREPGAVIQAMGELEKRLRVEVNLQGEEEEGWSLLSFFSEMASASSSSPSNEMTLTMSVYDSELWRAELVLEKLTLHAEAVVRRMTEGEEASPRIETSNPWP